MNYMDIWRNEHGCYTGENWRYTGLHRVTTMMGSSQETNTEMRMSLPGFTGLGICFGGVFWFGRPWWLGQFFVSKLWFFYGMGWPLDLPATHLEIIALQPICLHLYLIFTVLLWSNQRKSIFTRRIHCVIWKSLRALAWNIATNRSFPKLYILSNPWRHGQISLPLQYGVNRTEPHSQIKEAPFTSGPAVSRPMGFTIAVVHRPPGTFQIADMVDRIWLCAALADRLRSRFKRLARLFRPVVFGVWSFFPGVSGL